MNILEKIDNYLNEGSYSGRAWSGNLKKIDALLAWMYDKDILNKTEKKKKDSLFHQYYRYYNDGDFPRVLSSRGVSKFADKGVIERALEDQLEDFIKIILSKYMSKVDRTEFRYDELLGKLETVLSIVDDEDVHGLVNYWVGTLNPNRAENVIKQVAKLKVKYDSLEKKVNKACNEYQWKNTYDNPHRLTMFHKRMKMKEVGIWTKEFEKAWIDIKKDLLEIKELLENVISSVKKLRELYLLEK